MKTIVLPGYSSKNKDWAGETAHDLKEAGIESESCDWRHWENPQIKWNPSEESKIVLSKVGENQTNFVAKSLGTLVLMHILGSDPKKVGKIILCGVPINDMNEDELRNYKVLSDFDPNRIIIIQNSEDFHGSFVGVRNFISQINPHIKIIEKSGSTHEYPYSEDFEEFLKT